MHNIELKPSSIHGCGVFATKDISPKEVIEECPVIIFQRLELEYRNELSNRLFFWDEANSAIVLGCGSMYNHAKDYNATFSVDRDNQRMIFIATKHIATGSEILVNYGDDWFSSRDNKTAVINQQERKNNLGLLKVSVLLLILLILSKIFPVGL